MIPRIYIETSVISYLTARPSRDLLLLARQQYTRDFWSMAGQYYEPLISALVMSEIRRGDETAAAERVTVCNLLAQLPLTEAAVRLAQQLIDIHAVPATEPEDALHIALATIAEVDYLASWNFAHIVGPSAKLKLQFQLKELGYKPPAIASPEDILEELML
jgi:predicted nucleic acid-binding protein